ncbi:hypothetical protein ACO0E1_12695 [Curtobacterium sp. RRHDQ66]|uniref:hypothetical protein n=1 Tax=Curtobacterium guangdongense TaxID=3413380 RepID=UPI003BF163DB
MVDEHPVVRVAPARCSHRTADDIRQPHERLIVTSGVEHPDPCAHDPSRTKPAEHLEITTIISRAARFEHDFLRPHTVQLPEQRFKASSASPLWSLTITDVAHHDAVLEVSAGHELEDLEAERTNRLVPVELALTPGHESSELLTELLGVDLGSHRSTHEDVRAGTAGSADLGLVDEHTHPILRAPADHGKAAPRKGAPLDRDPDPDPDPKYQIPAPSSG